MREGYSITDADTGDELYCLPGLALTVVGAIDNVTGFTDRKNGYVSQELAQSGSPISFIKGWHPQNPDLSIRGCAPVFVEDSFHTEAGRDEF